mgnify:CR=1 FL=1
MGNKHSKDLHLSGGTPANALHLSALLDVQEAAVFDFGASRSAPPVVLLLDRRDDPVTPLLTQVHASERRRVRALGTGGAYDLTFCD